MLHRRHGREGRRRPAARGARARGRAAAGRPASRPRPRPARRRRRPSVDDEDRRRPRRSRSRGTRASRASGTWTGRRPSPARRPAPPATFGTRRPVTSSPARRSVRRLPSTKSAIGTTRVPSADATSTAASSASRLGSPSAAGEAFTTFPHTVPAFWICRPPIVRAAARSPSSSGGSGVSARSVQVVSAGIRHAVAVVGHAPQARERRDVEHRSVDRAGRVGRVDVRPARDDQPRLGRQDRERLVEPVRAEVRRERAGDAGRHDQAATLGRTSLASRSRFAGSQFSGLSTRWSTPPRASTLARIRSATSSASPSR